jgi:hypothetical protein
MRCLRDKPYKYRELKRALKEIDKRFQFPKGKGKGSEQPIYHPDINGEPKAVSVKHHGDNTELGKGTIDNIRNTFNIPKCPKGK